MADSSERNGHSANGKISPTQRQFDRRILITGGAGFIGSHVCEVLVKKYPNYFIINLDKLDYCATKNNFAEIIDCANYKFIRGDLCEPDFVRYIFQEERIDTVIHFAAQSHVDNSFWSSLEFTRVNAYGSHVLVNAAHEAGVKRFIHMSTDEVYGGNSKVALDEKARLQPTNPYAASKAAAECIVLSYWESFKFPVIITRANNIYGPRQYPEKVIPKFISLLERDRKCFIHGAGNAVRNFLYVRDLARAIDLVLHKGEDGQIYNIGTDFELSVLDLAKLLIRQLKGSDSENVLNKYLQFVEDRPFNDLRYPMDSSKIQSLGWAPEKSWEDGIKETVAWYIDPANRAHWPSAEEALLPFPTGSNTMTFQRGLQNERVDED